MGADPDVELGIPLSAAVAQVRRELVTAIEEGRDSPVAFEAGPVELEFTVAFDRSTGGDAGVRVWVLSLGAKGEQRRAEAHRLTVSLTPVDRQGQRRLIGSSGTH